MEITSKCMTENCEDITGNLLAADTELPAQHKVYVKSKQLIKQT